MTDKELWEKSQVWESSDDGRGKLKILESVEKFAELVRADERDRATRENAYVLAERNKLAQWMMAQGYATGHGDTMEQLLKELEWQIRERERKACALLCDQLSDSSRDLRFGAAVRARGQAS